MKRLVFLFLLTLTLSAQAQEKAAPDAGKNDMARPAPASRVWITAGPGFSSLTNQDGLIESARTGVSADVAYELSLTPMFSVQVGVAYIQKGENIDAITVNPNNNGAFKLNYFELPVLARVNLPVYKNGEVSFMAGPYGALAVTRKMDNTNTTDLTNLVNTTTDETSSIKSWDVGARFGFAYDMPVTDMLNATLGVNYDLGLVNISKLDGATVHNRSLLVALGLGWRM